MRVVRNISKLMAPTLIGLFIVIGSFPSCSKQESVIKIGAIFSMTGDVGAYGERSRNGFLLAVEQLNSKGGINGKQILPIVEDAKSIPTDGLSAYKKLVSSDNVNVIVGDVLSSTTMAIVPLLEKDKVVLFAPGASNPQLKGASRYFFRNWTSDDFDGYAMAHYMASEGIDSAAILVQQSDYTLGLAAAFEKEFSKLGGMVTIREQFMTGDTDFRSQIAKLKSKRTKIVYLVGQSREDGTILRQSAELAFSPRWFSNLTVETPECAEIAGDAIDGVTFTTPAFDATSGDPFIENYVNAFTAKYGIEPEATSAHAYDAMNILARVISEVGINTDSIAAGLRRVKDYPGVSGKTTFDEDGDVIKDVFVKQIRGGQSVLLKHFEF